MWRWMWRLVVVGALIGVGAKIQRLMTIEREHRVPELPATDR